MGKLALVLIIFSVPLLFSQLGWITQSSGTNQTLLAVDFIDSDTGIVVGGGGTIVRSIDGGLNWTIQPSNTSVSLISDDFADTQNGVAVGRNGFDQIIILLTSNGGESWEDVSTNIFQTNVIKVFNKSKDQIKIFFNRGAGGNTLVLNNGGQSWTEYGVLTFGSDGSLTDISFLNSQIGTATAWGKTTNQYYGLLYRTTDGGRTWNRIMLSPTPLNSVMLYTIEYISSDIIVVSGKTNTVGAEIKILRSTNAGVSWVEQTTGTTNLLRDMTFLNDYVGMAVGDGGTILRTTNGGATFIGNEENTFVEPNDFLLQQNYPNPFNPSTKIS